MARRYAELTFTDSVKRTQQRYGSREQGLKLERMDWQDDRLSDREAAFISDRDSFYVASVGENGWPYLQFRGGPTGFVKVIGERTLAYADFRGNLQYITIGNIQHDNRVALFFMDYASRRRLKVMARAEVLEASESAELIKKLADPNYNATVERAVVYHVEAFDWNCPQHITPRWTQEEVTQIIGDTQNRLQELVGENQRLRAEIEQPATKT